MVTPKDCERIKRLFESKGLTQAEWAEKNGYTRQEVTRVLNGYTKARRGRAHALAVALGLKAGA